ncbi:MAG: hypothetical protein A2958_00585 [Candidatus Levybacteria bacterium RIFCSPLOWO2_01_FULL_38_13]|nr:MAG: hypothetical protein A2629_00480 [Candidatus Levybacteria bacterium RIFCSPHIGHO2_01_FULL_41_15]OGH34786.1 MAG: hypothetical protein A2958_00585 [Candidatus Levybacteria bacterium RIFCSPLOWO2_01_FULL_38_13]
MLSPAERGFSFHPEDGKQAPQFLTQEELSMFVPNYHFVLHERLYSIGVLKEGETLDLIFPSRQHDNSNSEAEYIYEGTIGDDWIFIYFMGPNKKTSSHKHPHEGVVIEEDYHLLRGKMFLHLGGDGSSQVELTENNNFTTVPPNTLHRGSTDGHFAFVLVRMRGAASIPRDKLHIPD